MNVDVGGTDDLERTREPLFNAPAVVLATIAILWAVHVVRLLLVPDVDWALIVSYGVLPARVTGALNEIPPLALPGYAGRLLPLLSYAFLHGGWLHLALNSAWLLAFGTPIARRIGSARFLALAAVSAILAALGYVAIHPDSVVPVIGASGAISGMMGAAFRLLFTPWQGVTGARLAPLTEPRLLTASAVWIIANLAMAFTGVSVGAPAETVAWEAHIAGFVVGLLLLPLFDRRRMPN